MNNDLFSLMIIYSDDDCQIPTCFFFGSLKNIYISFCIPITFNNPFKVLGKTGFNRMFKV